jgi:hypothetical protein
VSKKEQSVSELNDKAAKLRSAQVVADAPGATDKDKADLKLAEQDVIAEKLRVRRTNERATSPTEKAKSKVDAKLDEALEDSFPGSDPVSFLEAAPIKAEDMPLSTVPQVPPKASRSDK